MQWNGNSCRTCKWKCLAGCFGIITWSWEGGERRGCLGGSNGLGVGHYLEGNWYHRNGWARLGEHAGWGQWASEGAPLSQRGLFSVGLWVNLCCHSRSHFFTEMTFCCQMERFLLISLDLTAAFDINSHFLCFFWSSLLFAIRLFPLSFCFWKSSFVVPSCR